MRCVNLIYTPIAIVLLGCADPNKPPEHPDNPIPQEPEPTDELDSDQDPSNVEDLVPHNDERADVVDENK